MVAHAFEHGQHSAGPSPATNLSLVGVGRLKWDWWSRTQEPTDLQTLAIRCVWEDSPKHVCLVPGVMAGHIPFIFPLLPCILYQILQGSALVLVSSIPVSSSILPSGNVP